MTDKILHIFEYLIGNKAREAFEASTPARGYFETEEAWIAFDLTHGYDVMEFPMKWQAWAYASTDLSFDAIWDLNENEFCKIFNTEMSNALQTYFKTPCKETA